MTGRMPGARACSARSRSPGRGQHQAGDGRAGPRSASWPRGSAGTRSSGRRSRTCGRPWPTCGPSPGGSRAARGPWAASSRTRRSTRTSPPSWRGPSGACSSGRSSAPRSGGGTAPARREPATVRPTSVYRCQACGFQAGKWYGRCPDCGEFNTIVEERTEPRAGPDGGAPATRPRRAAAVGRCPCRRCRPAGAARVHSGVAELDRVLGGGVVPGSLVLIGGDPGIGKSTLLQASAALAAATGPSSTSRARSRRPRSSSAPTGSGDRRADLYILAETDLEAVARARGGAQAARRGRRLDPDRVPARARVGAREREPGARVRPPASWPGQEPGIAGLPGRPRHQGGRARRPARARAHGRHRPLLRGRAARTRTASCGRSRTASARPTRSASSR